MQIFLFVLLAVAHCNQGYSFGDHVPLGTVGNKAPFETAYCNNACTSAKDGVCDDFRGRNTCAIGTDCDDCGSMETLYFGEEDGLRDDRNKLYSTDDADDNDNNSNVMIVDVEVNESSAPVYQSAIAQRITVTGSNFNDDLSLNLEPSLQAGVDYVLEVTSSTTAVLSLLPDKAWRSEPGCIYVLKGDGIESSESAADRVCIATVLFDPVVVSSANIVRDTATKSITIRGHGLDSTDQVKVVLHPTPVDAYTVEARGGLVELKLVPGRSWSQDAQGDRNLFVVSVDTGAGPVIFDNPVQVGYIVKDTYVGVEEDSFSYADVAADGVTAVRRRLTSIPLDVSSGSNVVHFVLAVAMLLFIFMSFVALCVNTNKPVARGTESVPTLSSDCNV